MSKAASQRWWLGQQIAVCDGKMVFRSMGAALKFNHHRGFPNRPYRCVICGHWHLTSKGAR